jgi:hypothetical protein
MALTRANVELILVARVGTLLTAVGLDGTTVDGTNTDLNDPIGYGIRQTGGTVDSAVLVDDTDVARIGESDYDELLDKSEYRTLLSIQGNFVLIDTKIGPRDEKWSSLGNNLDKLIAAKKKMIDSMYLISEWSLAADIVEFDFSTLD